MNDLKAILFDLDGTLINTEPIHAKALLQAFKEYQIILDEEKFKEEFLGACDYAVWNAVVTDKDQVNFHDLIKSKNQHFKIILNETSDIEVKELIVEGALDLLARLTDQKMKIALVTASDSFQTEVILNKIGFKDYFDVICTATDTFFSKPNPSPYFLAMRQLLVGSEDVLIFEDSFYGLSAAMQTKARIIGLETSVGVKANKKFQHLKFIKNFKDFYV